MIVKYLQKKNIVSKSNGKFDSVITWPLDIPVSSLMMFVILHFFLFIVFLPNLYREKVPVLSNHSL
jgi:hypothetical protein